MLTPSKKRPNSLLNHSGQGISPTSIEFDLTTLTDFDGYHVSGSADRKLKPKVVFRDKQFTYLQWQN